MPSRNQAQPRPHNGHSASSYSAWHTLDISNDTNHVAGANGSAGVLHQGAVHQLDNSSSDVSDVPAPLETSGGWADDIMLTLPKPFMEEHRSEPASSAAASMHQQAAMGSGVPDPALHVAREASSTQGLYVTDANGTVAQRRSASGAPCIGRVSQARKSDATCRVSGAGTAWINRATLPRNQGRSSPVPCASPAVPPISSVLQDSRWSQGARSASSFARGSSARERHVLNPAAPQAIPIGWTQGHCVSDGASTPLASGPIVPTPQPAVPPVPIPACQQGGGCGSCRTRSSVGGGAWVTRDSISPSGVRVVQPQRLSTNAARSISPAAQDARMAGTPNRAGIAMQVVSWPTVEGGPAPAPAQCANVFALELGAVQGNIVPSAGSQGSLSGRLVQPSCAPASLCVQASPRGNMSVPFGATVGSRDASVARWRVSSSPRQRMSLGSSHGIP
mmetsp:Transcript_45754/g.106235  ORF Transcript_45754/g.106235 Transcript_45754/m.106235 type:complete len:448 (-) Transcript_45754:79-1422(-)